MQQKRGILMEEFKILTNKEEENLSTTQLIDYYKNLRKYYKDELIEFKIKFLKFINPFVCFLMKTTKNFKIKIINKEKLAVNGPTIYVANHSNFHDIPTMCEIVPSPFTILLGVQNLRIIDKIVFFLNGRIYVDRHDSVSKANSKIDLIKTIVNGGNLLVFPEATWNLTENKLILPLNWGVIDVAKKTKATIKPIVMEYEDDECNIMIGDDFTVKENDSKQEKIEELTEQMATMKWELIERKGISNRKDIGKQDLDIYTIDRCAEYPCLDVEYEKSVIRRPYITEEEAFEHLKNIEINQNNLFLQKQKNEYIKRYK